MGKAIVLCATMAIALCGCVRSSVMPLAADMIQITATSTPVCGGGPVQEFVIRRAAFETINRDFDSFLILDATTAREFRGFLGGSSYTSGTATTRGFGRFATAQGSSITTFTPPTPMYVSIQSIVVKMFKNDDPLRGNAISARQTLGPDWATIIEEKPETTC